MSNPSSTGYRLLAHSMALRDLCKKVHWQTSGATIHELHLAGADQ